MPDTRKRAREARSKRTARSTHHARSDRYWVKSVKTVSTFPPPGLFKKDASTIARSLASKRVSPKGIGSGLRMLLYYINRAGRQLTRTRRAELEKAKRLMRKRMATERSRGRSRQGAA